MSLLEEIKGYVVRVEKVVREKYQVLLTPFREMRINSVIEIDIPGRANYRLAHLVLDVSGTIASDGELISGVADRIAKLRSSVEVHLITADTHGRQEEIDAELGIEGRRLQSGATEEEQKADFVRWLGNEGTVTIGNGANDALMLREAALGIAVLGKEGLSVVAFQNADLVVVNILDALDLLLHPKRLVATLRR
ncbi:MAG: HAD family hydrolase [Chloroflexota bacterium]|nr:HAD family hydrolase [Chloroflexota bacterium]